MAEYTPRLVIIEDQGLNKDEDNDRKTLNLYDYLRNELEAHGVTCYIREIAQRTFCGPRMQSQLQNMKYGTLVRAGKQLYVKCQGLDGDMMQSVKDGGNWLFIDPERQGPQFTAVHKSFTIVYRP